MQYVGMRRRTSQYGRPSTVAKTLILGSAAYLSVVVGPCLTSFVAGWPVQGGQEHSALGQAHRKFGETQMAAGAGAATDQCASVKAKLMDLLGDDLLPQEVLRPEGKPTRGRLDETILELERLNPSEEPVYSELIDGSWIVKYSGSYAPGLLSSPTRELALFLYGGGFSLGNVLNSFANGFWGQNLGVKVLAKKVTIFAGRDVDAKAEVEVGGQKDSLCYSAELMPLSGRRMSEEIISVNLPDPVGKQDLPLELRRSILVTYLDEEIMVVRDESGVSEVLVREMVNVAPSAPAPASSSTVPTVTEDGLFTSDDENTSFAADDSATGAGQGASSSSEASK